MTDSDSFIYSSITNIIKSDFEYIDEVFFNTSYRKNFCTSKGFYQRIILTLFSKITYKRRYYYKYTKLLEPKITKKLCL